jgi:hypothetical protein
MSRNAWLAALAAAAVAILLVMATFAHAEPQEAVPPPAACHSLAEIEGKLLPHVAAENIVTGAEAQRLADALSRHYGKPSTEVSTVAAFLSGESAFVFGFDNAGCPAAAGTMPLAVFDDARVAAGLKPLLPPPKASGASI